MPPTPTRDITSGVRKLLSAQTMRNERRFSWAARARARDFGVLDENDDERERGRAERNERARRNCHASGGEYTRS